MFIWHITLPSPRRCVDMFISVMNLCISLLSIYLYSHLGDIQKLLKKIFVENWICMKTFLKDLQKLIVEFIMIMFAFVEDGE